MRMQIEQALQNILGMPLWSIGRAADIEWFAFGEQRREVVDRKGRAKVVSDYALHIQCAWRIRQGARIAVASNDRFYPPSDLGHEDLTNFEWDKPGANRLDKRVENLLEDAASRPLKVLSFSADEVGGFQLDLGGTNLLEVFPDNSGSTEHWRLFQPYQDGEHFVVTNLGIERQ